MVSKEKEKRKLYVKGVGMGKKKRIVGRLLYYQILCIFTDPQIRKKVVMLDLTCNPTSVCVCACVCGSGGGGCGFWTR